MKFLNIMAVAFLAVAFNASADPASVDGAVNDLIAAVKAQGGKVGICTDLTVSYANGKLEVKGQGITQDTNELKPMDKVYDLSGKNVRVLSEGHDSQTTLRFARTYVGESAAVTATVHPIVTLVYEKGVLEEIGVNCETAQWVQKYHAGLAEAKKLTDGLAAWFKAQQAAPATK
jgi:hypothetical protein